MDKYIIVNSKAIPEIFIKVLEVKELIKNGEVSGITEAVKKIGISRSSYYKYCDYVFPVSESVVGKKVTITFLLTHESGILSNLLSIIASNGCNVLTISQDAPINNIANLSITFDMKNISVPFDELISKLRNLQGVNKLTLIAME